MRVLILENEREIYHGFEMIASFEPYKDGILLSRLPACTIGRYFAALNVLYDKGYRKIYEEPVK